MANTATKSANDFTLTDSQFENISAIIYDTAGIHLGDNKKDLIHARLFKVIQKRCISVIRYICIFLNMMMRETFRCKEIGSVFSQDDSSAIIEIDDNGQPEISSIMTLILK